VPQFPLPSQVAPPEHGVPALLGVKVQDPLVHCPVEASKHSPGGVVHGPPQGTHFPVPSQVPPGQACPAGCAVYWHIPPVQVPLPATSQSPGVLQGSPPHGRQFPMPSQAPLAQEVPFTEGL
jgi:hypothetical protein